MISLPVYRPRSQCREHGSRLRRAECRSCNAAYMKDYMRKRRVIAPEHTIWQRAHRRAIQKGIPFAITLQDVAIPKTCPVLGIPITLGSQRSDHSPSLDRIIPSKGYVPGNVRVISDRANRLKGDQDFDCLQIKAISGPEQLRADYKLVANYVRREVLIDHLHRLDRCDAVPEDLKQKALMLASELHIGLSVAAMAEEGHLTSAELEKEFNLGKRAVLQLRRRAGFPQPKRLRHAYIFDRFEVMQWVSRQPDPTDLLSPVRRRPVSINRSSRLAL